MNFIKNIAVVAIISLVFGSSVYADDTTIGGMTEEEFLAEIAEIERDLKIIEDFLNDLDAVIEELEKGSDQISKTLLSEDV